MSATEDKFSTAGDDERAQAKASAGAGGDQAETKRPGSRTKAERQTLARELWSRSVAIVGTPSALYLASRGIDPQSLGPDFVRHYPAKCCLVIPIRDAAGELTAVQRIFVSSAGIACKDGKGKKRKLSLGVVAGAAFVAPGGAAGGVLACDGPEDALSLWQATGRTVYCGFGVGAIARLPYPLEVHITLVIDNKEADQKAADLAASQLLAQGHRVKLAHMPADVKDANECLQKHGPDAVKAAIDAAVEPPQYLSYRIYTMSATGLTAKVKTKTDDGTVERTVPVSGPFEVIGRCRTTSSTDWGKWLRFTDHDGVEHTIEVPDRLFSGLMAPLANMLRSAGLAIHGGDKLFRDYLRDSQPIGRVTLVDRSGWHDIDGRAVFVLPDEIIGPVGSDLIVLRGDVSAANYARRGSLEDWKNGVGALSAGHDLAVLALSTAFAGPLLGLADIEGGGVHIHGKSSSGKGSISQMAASVWGKGSESGGFLRTWSTTANALEAVAAMSSDTVLMLDELHLCEPHHVASVVYTLANGAGKSRAGRSGEARHAKSWRIMVWSTGELTVEQKIAQKRGATASAGQSVRLTNISADRGLGYGVFNNPGAAGSSAKLSRACKRAAETHYGTAGPAFVRQLIDREIARDEIGDRIEGFVGLVVPEGGDGQVERVANRFGLIAAAGEYAIEFGIVPWKPGDATRAAAWGFRGWLDQRGSSTEAAEVKQAIERVRLFIERHGESRFDDLEKLGKRDDYGKPLASPVHNRLGWRRGDGEQRQWLIPPETWKSEICAGLDPQFVAKALADRGMMIVDRDGKMPSIRIDGRQQRVRVVTAKILD